MSKILLLIMSFCAALCAPGGYAQQPYPLTLDQLFELADARSKTLAVGQASYDEALAATRELRNARLPEIELSLSASYLGNGCLTDRDFDHGLSVDMPHFGNNFAIQVTQLIYGGGAVNQQIALSHLREEMAAVDIQATRSRVRFLLAGFYLDLFKLQNTLRVYDRNIELAEAVINDTKARNAQGIALKNDITRYELQRQRLELARTRIQHAIGLLNADLVTMLELPHDAQIVPDSTLLQQSLPLEGELCWQERASQEAYGIRQSELAIRMGERGERLARSERLPKLSLIAANHFDGPITIEVPVINKNFNYWFVGVGLSFRLSSLYKSGKSIQRAALTTELHRRRMEETIEQTSLSVKRDYIGYIESHDELSTHRKNVTLAHENYAVIENRYRNEMALVTDMLDAASARLDAELQLVNAHIQVAFHYLKLKHTSGTL